MAEGGRYEGFGFEGEAEPQEEEERGPSYEEVEREALRQARKSTQELAEENADFEAEAGKPPMFDPQRNDLRPPQSAADHFFRWGELSYAQLRKVKQGPLDVVQTPFPTLNRMCLVAGGGEGLAHRWHTLIAGGSNVGKTNLALTFAEHAMRRGENVCYIGLEEDPENVGTRLAAIASGTSLKEIGRGKHFDVEKARDAARVVTELEGSLLMNREPLFDLDLIEQAILEMSSSQECRTFIIDYLQLARTGQRDGLLDRITEVSSTVRHLMRREKLLSVACSQLNRRASSQMDRCPTRFDLMGGSPLENDADCIFLICHQEDHYSKNEKRRWTDTKLHFDKNKHGPTGSFDVRFEWSTGRFVELDKGRGEPRDRPAPPEPATQEKLAI